MKLSLAWIFDHIAADLKTINISDLVIQFNQKVAEIESFTAIELKIDCFRLVQVKSIMNDQVIAYDFEKEEEVFLSIRPDAWIDNWYLTYQEDQEKPLRWAFCNDMQSPREGLVPSMSYHHSPQEPGSWRKQLKQHDVIIEVDNKSVTHRPDLWGHRGFAREIAALLGKPFKSLHSLLMEVPIISSGTQAQAGYEIPYGASIGSLSLCKRFALTTLPDVQNTFSPLWLIQLLLITDNKPINYMVDITNFVMLDLGQPMHAFDADHLIGTSLHVRYAHQGETITLLDGDTLILSAHDLVVADEGGPVALAGIMGGKRASVSLATKRIALEAACFDPTTIRLSSVRHKKRTDASARFEKSLDPEQNITALKRFLSLISSTSHSPIVSLGIEVKKPIIEIAHTFIEARLGLSVTQKQVVDILESLEFDVRCLGDFSTLLYEVTVPTFRATKDIAIKEDILEEIGRMVGYDLIKPVLPMRAMTTHSLQPLMRLRSIKNYCSYALRMREVSNYPLYNEDILAKLSWHPANTIELANPLAHNRKLLVSSLVPNILDNIAENIIGAGELRFFEINKTWCRNSQIKEEIKEQLSLALVFWHARSSYTFYHYKKELIGLFDMLGLKVKWERLTDNLIEESKNIRPWYNLHQTAVLWLEDIIIGYVGMGSSSWMQPLIEHGSACIVELDADYLRSFISCVKEAAPLPKYQQVTIDISMLVALSVSVADLTRALSLADIRITQVQLADFFAKDEWIDKKSVTMRLTVRDLHKTLEKEEIDSIYAAAIDSLNQFGAIIR